MSNVEQHYTELFRAELIRLRDKYTSKLAETTVSIKINDMGNAYHFPIIGNGELDEVVSYNRVVEASTLDHSTRFVTSADFVKIYDIDNRQVRKTNVGDYLSVHADALKRAIEKKKDNIIIDALFSDAREGTTGQNIISFNSNNVIADGSTDLTTDKLRDAIKKLEEHDVDTTEDLFCIISPSQKRSLSASEEWKNMDYVMRDDSLIKTGVIARWQNVNFIMNNSLPKTGNIRSNPLYTKRALGLVSNSEPEIKIIDHVHDKENTTRIKAFLNMGATRLLDSEVIKIQNQES